MKKLIFILLLLPCAAMAQQDTTGSVTDSSRMYRYTNVYSRVNSFTVQPPGARRGPIQSNEDSAKWVTSIIVSVYNSKADYLAGKQELFLCYPMPLKTDLYPLRKEIWDRAKTVIK